MKHLNFFTFLIFNFKILTKQTRKNSNDLERPGTNSNDLERKKMNQKIIECLNKHFWRRDDFGLISYPISPDGRTADARTIQEQFGKEGGDGSDGLLYSMIRKATKAFGERAFVDLLNDGLDQDNFWGVLELRVVEIIHQECFLGRFPDPFDDTDEENPILEEHLIYDDWYYLFMEMGKVQLYDTSYYQGHPSLIPINKTRREYLKYWDDKYRSQYREYVEYPKRLKEAMRHSNFTSKKYLETVWGATCLAHILSEKEKNTTSGVQTRSQTRKKANQ